MRHGLHNLNVPDRIVSLREKTFSAVRYVSFEQAKIITDVYRQYENEPVCIKRANSLARALHEMRISVDPEEYFAGNRTSEIRAGVVFPEAGINWIGNELETLPTRAQDPFEVREEDKTFFHTVIKPFWKGKSLEDDIYSSYGKELSELASVVKINQKDHAQGHICPDVAEWLKKGPSGLLKATGEMLRSASPAKRDFYRSAEIVMKASRDFIIRYASLAAEMAENDEDDAHKRNLIEISEVCRNISENPPASFREALQSVWFLFVILHMESNASSFSPGRMDQYLYQFYKRDIDSGRINESEAVELLDALFIKFNQIVYLRNSHSARYFAGFPIGFNVTIGGLDENGDDATNELSYLILKTQYHLRLPQPNLTARIHRKTSGVFLELCSKVIGMGNGMPQIVNDESIIPAIREAGISVKDSLDYALVGCVELSTQGNYLGWSDAAMFNLVKVLELTINNGVCMITGERLGPATGNLDDHHDFISFLNAYKKQIGFFASKMIKACEVVEKAHQVHLPSPFLSCVVRNCLKLGRDVTQGGVEYNYSGIQAIQVANVADSLAVLKKLVYDDRTVSPGELTVALRTNFSETEILRQICINKVPKYGNDIEWVDDLGREIIEYFALKLGEFENYRGGRYQMGLYTVSAHVPMGQNVAATPDGRLARTPLADGGMSPMYGRDKNGPTAVLNSVSRVGCKMATNGTLLNMKFLPTLFSKESDRGKFSSLLRSFTHLPVHHVQFNVITSDELIRAKADPDSYRGLTIRVAGYTAYFTELAGDLQDEIIKRTTQGENE